MAKKREKKQNQEPVAEVVTEKEKTPVANPAAKVMQLTPIVQPIAFVPYSSQEQPLYMYDDEPVEEYEDEIIEEPVVEAPRKKKASAASIIVAILSLLLIAVYCLPYIEALSGTLLPYAGFGEVSGLAVILEFVETLDYTNIVNLAIVATPVFALLTLIGCLIGVCHKGVNVFSKITVFFELLVALVGLIAALVGGQDLAGSYGFYIVVGLGFVSMLIAYLAKND